VSAIHQLPATSSTRDAQISAHQEHRMPAQTQPVRIAFIGAGRMATALARGLIEAGVARSRDMVASDVSSEARSSFESATSASTTSSNREAVRDRDVVVLAVKPQTMAGVLTEIAGELTAEQLVISIAAGIPLSRLSSVLGEQTRLVRVMPNTPCLVGEGAAAFSRGALATEEDARLVESLLSTVGLAIEVAESQLDAVTGLSGSGPAYCFQIIEALSDGGVRQGLSRDVATRLAAQTLLGAGRMVLETGLHPGELKDAVTSPGGTTIYGLHALERGGLRHALMDAVEAATLRSQELGRS
jgi:pyrroline-5-carboxylate reductase